MYICTFTSLLNLLIPILHEYWIPFIIVDWDFCYATLVHANSDLKVFLFVVGVDKDKPHLPPVVYAPHPFPWPGMDCVSSAGYTGTRPLQSTDFKKKALLSGPSLSKLQIDSEIVNVVENAFITCSMMALSF